MATIIGIDANAIASVMAMTALALTPFFLSLNSNYRFELVILKIVHYKD